MPPAVAVVVNILGRILLTAIFLSAAVANKIPNFNQTADTMQKQGVPAPKFMLVGAIVFLVVGSVSIILGYRARIGAALLLAFLVLATYWFHDFWTLAADEDRQQQQIQFMKNLGLMGAMLMIIAMGSGPGSLDARTHKSTSETR